MPLIADRNEIARHFAALFANADNGTYLSIRGFVDQQSKPWGYSTHWQMLPIKDSLADVIETATNFATAAANAPVPVVVCPPNCTFNNATTATEKDVANGLVLTVEIDTDAAAKKANLETILGPATEVLASGGEWVDPQTGAVEDKLHVHWRLDKPTRTPEEHAQLKEARDLAARLIGADTSAVPLVHPLRLPGSWHRKTATPRLASIIAYSPDNEVTLADALQKLRQATGVGASGQQGSSPQSSPQAPLLDILAALECIPNDDSGSAEDSWNQWNTTGMQIFAAYGGSPAGLAAFHAWSAKAKKKYDAGNTDERWKHWRRHGPTRTGVGALFNRAKAANPNFTRPTQQQTQQQAQPQPTPQPQKLWPTLGSDAFHGLAGEVVDLLRPHTEADPVAILIHFLIEVGNVIGRHAYYLVEATRHHANFFALIVGRTAKARKGTSADRTRQVLEIIDPNWTQQCFLSGLSTGEGLIWAIRDPIEGLVWHGTGINRKQVLEITDPGVEDKRLLVLEPEFARTISVMERPGNTLSPVLRASWDGKDLEIRTKSSPAKATDAHVSVVAHITEEELVERFTSTDKSNGFGNRFLFVLVRRSQLLPFGGTLKPADIVPLAKKVNQAIELAETLDRVELSLPARPRWREIYEELAKEKPGLTGSILARGEPQVIRLALLYALLDEHVVIDTPHLDAAYTLWNYCQASAEYIFGDKTGNVLADEILTTLRQIRPAGMTRADLGNLFVGHHKAGRVSEALTLLLKYGKVRMNQQPTTGRPVEIWFAV